jgi:hypothetical protein
MRPDLLVCPDGQRYLRSVRQYFSKVVGISPAGDAPGQQNRLSSKSPRQWPCNCLRNCIGAYTSIPGTRQASCAQSIGGRSLDNAPMCGDRRARSSWVGAYCLTGWTSHLSSARTQSRGRSGGLWRPPRQPMEMLAFIPTDDHGKAGAMARAIGEWPVWRRRQLGTITPVWGPA